MRKRPEPTTAKNAASRLFLRFLLCYLAAVPVGLFLAADGLLTIDPMSVGKLRLLFLGLSLAGGLLTVTMPFLAVLSLCCALYDMTVLLYFTRLTQIGAIGILPWNACFFLTVFSATLFLVSAAQSAWFAFQHTERDLRRLFSVDFGRFLIRSLLTTAVALSLALLWPQICAALGLPQAPF